MKGPAMTPSLSVRTIPPPVRQGAAKSLEAFDSVMARVRAHYLEMPGLSLTFAQARRLLGLDDSVCGDVLATLVQDGFLKQTGDERYVLSAGCS
jgi:DNA-binding IclR family transcriptional regulator